MKSSHLLFLLAAFAAYVSHASAGRDYYDLLDVPRDAPLTIIKKSYRRLAKLYHPDKHPGNKKMESKFKDISKAYEVLSDQQKRQTYDQFGEEGLQGGGNGGGHGGFGGFHGGGNGGFRMEFDASMFEDMFGGGFGGFDAGGGFGGFEGGGRRHQRQAPRKKVCFQNKICEDGRCYMVKECKS